MTDTTFSAKRDDLQFPRTKGALSGFDSVVTTSDPTDLSVSGYSANEIMLAIRNLQETGLPNDASNAISALIKHIADFNNPHEDDLQAFIDNYITEILRRIVPGTVPDAYPIWSFNPDLELAQVLLGCTCTRASTMRVMTKSGRYTTVAENTLATDWSTGTALVPCFSDYALTNTVYFPDTTSTSDTVTLTSLTVSTKDLSATKIKLPDGTSVIHPIVASGDTTVPSVSVKYNTNQNTDYTVSFISYLTIDSTSNVVQFTIPEISADVVTVTFSAQNNFVCNTVGAITAGYQILLNGSVRWFCCGRTGTKSTITPTWSFPYATGTSMSGKTLLSIDVIQCTNTTRPAPILLVGETMAAQTLSFALTSPAVSHFMMNVNYLSPWLTTTAVATTTAMVTTADFTISVSPTGFSTLSQTKTLSSLQYLSTLNVSVNDTTLILGVSGTKPSTYQTTQLTTTEDTPIVVNAFNGYLVDMSYYDVADRLNATEFLVNG